jgi:predicted Zn-dependent protease
MRDHSTASKPRLALEAPARMRPAIALLCAAAMLVGQGRALAQAPGQPQVKVNVIRDAEIEELLREYTRPILRAAKLSGQSIEVVLIGDGTFNAFVADGRRIFVNTGAIYDSTTPNQLIGVLAHETGHIAGGHLARMREQIANAQTAAILAMLLAAGGIAASAMTGSRDVGNLATGAIMLPQSVLMGSILSYQRQQEEAADRAAVTFLNATGQSARGMLETFQRFAQDTLFLSRQVNPYLLSHPMARERISQLENVARTSPNFDRRDPPALQLRHDMVRAKLAGFMARPETVFRAYPPSNNTLPARYARAIVAYRHGNLNTAIAQIDALIAEQPRNPYFHELKGQALLESARARESIAPLRQAVALSNGAALIRMLLGQALVQSGDATLVEEAIRNLRQALDKEPNAPLGWRQIAIAYGRKGDTANADLASALAAFNEADFKTARQLALRAKSRFPTGSPGWLKSDDIINFKPPQLTQR